MEILLSKIEKRLRKIDNEQNKKKKKLHDRHFAKKKPSQYEVVENQSVLLEIERRELNWVKQELQKTKEKITG